WWAGRSALVAAAVVAPLPAAAGDQDNSVEIAVGEHSRGGDLSPVIDGLAVGHRQVGAIGHESVQVDHGAASLRDEPVFFGLPLVASASSRGADGLAAGVHEVSHAADVTIDCCKVCQLAFAPEECVESLVRPGGGAADYLACIVHPGGDAEGPPEGAQVRELSPVPEEGVSTLVSGR